MSRNRDAVIGLVVLVVLVAAGIIAFLLLQPGSEPPAAQESPTPAPSASASASAQPSPSFNEEMLGRRWTVLFIGTDVNATRESRGEPVNTDSLMLVSLSDDQSELTLVSLPRDTVDVPQPDGGTWERKINALYREEGVDTLVAAMEELYGVPIDGYAKIDMDGMSLLVQAVDGIEVSPDEPLVDPIVNLDLQPGQQELDASQVLGYVRSRVDQDYGRMARQQEVIVALVDKLVSPETDIDLGDLFEGIESFETDLPMDELPTLIELARRASEADVSTLVIAPPLITFEGDRGDGRGYVLEPDVDAIRDEVQSLIGS